MIKWILIYAVLLPLSYTTAFELWPKEDAHSIKIRTVRHDRNLFGKHFEKPGKKFVDAIKQMESKENHYGSEETEQDSNSGDNGLVYSGNQTYDGPVEKVSELNNDANDDDAIHEADDINSNPESKTTDIEDVNVIAETKIKGVLKDKNVSGSHVDMGDIMFHECEEEEVFGTGGNMPNPKCKSKLKKAHQKDAITQAGKMWSLPISYQINPSLRAAARKAIDEAMEEYALKTCITFKKQRAKDYLWFFSGSGSKSGCWSWMGRCGGKQDISLSPGCETRSTAIHEIMHALGFFHEQSRPDRDSYIRINWNNIDEPMSYNFNKQLRSNTDDYGFAYDYHSVMHYKRTAFGKWVSHWKQLESMTPLQAVATHLGQCPSCGMSQIDALQLNARYCNQQRDYISLDVLTNKVRNWMAIFNGDSNDDFRYELLNHLLLIYPNYYFTVSAYNPVAYNEYDKHSLYGYCAYVFAYYGRSVVVCFSRKDKKFASKAKEDEISNAAAGAIWNKGCDASTLLNTALEKVNSFKYDISLVHVVSFGSDLRTLRTGPHTKFYNVKCKGDKFASLVLMF